MLHEDPSSEWIYFLALVAPPASQTEGSGVPREVILLLDHSGSMSGPKWEAADWAAEQFLRDLSPQDEFALCLFHSSPLWFADQPRRAEQEDVEEAVKFLLEHRESGGTELGVAFEQGIHLKRSRDERARHLVIVTDAEVSDAARILRLADEEAQREYRRRISVLCIDAAPNSFLASELAERGGGVSRFLTSSPEEMDITTALDEVLKDWAQPVLADLRLGVGRAGVQSASGQLVSGGDERWSFIDLGDLPRGRALWLAGRAPRGDQGTLRFRAKTARGEEVASQEIELGKGANVRPALKALFGARRVLGLEYLINSGYSVRELSEQLEQLQYDAQEVFGEEGRWSKVYAENVRDDARKALRSLLVQEALVYGLASAETAFVAVRKEAGKPVERMVLVANALPLGWADHFAASATTMRAARRAGALFSASAPGPDIPVFLRRRASAGPGVHLSRRDQLASIVPMVAEPVEAPKPTVIFSGNPTFVAAEAVLFDSSRGEDAGKVAESATIRLLEVRFPDGEPERSALGPGLALVIFVGDLASPRARMALGDLLRRRGQRPLNISKAKGDIVRIVLVDPQGAWRDGAPRIEVGLAW